MLARGLELIFGYRRSVEFVVAHIYAIFFYKNIKKYFCLHKDKKIIIVSLGLPGYLDNISSILDELSCKGYLIVIFPEWNDEVELYNQQLVGYIKSNFKVFYNCSRVMPLFEASVFLSAIAGKNFYFPKNCKRLYYFHSLSGLDGFPLGGLDAYDTILAATPQQVDQLTLRYGMSKRIISAGYPKLDNLLIRVQGAEFNHPKESNQCIIFSPSFSDGKIYKDVSIFGLSEKIIETLLFSNYRVIFRPHPLSFKRSKDREFINEIVKKFKSKIILA
jgi:hypothetical protein